MDYLERDRERDRRTEAMYGTVMSQLREERGMSQSEAAKRGGLSLEEWQYFENSIDWPQKKSLMKICKGLGVTPQDFFYRIANLIKKIGEDVV